MQDRQLYEQILGIHSPWYVQRVELQLGEETGRVQVYLEHQPDQQWPCPECGKECAIYDHQPQRQWRHLDTCQYETILHASPPRSHCPEHGVRVVQLPWAESSSRFTKLFEGLAISWLRQASKSAVATQSAPRKDPPAPNAFEAPNQAGTRVQTNCPCTRCALPMRRRHRLRRASRTWTSILSFLPWRVWSAE